MVPELLVRPAVERGELVNLLLGQTPRSCTGIAGTRLDVLDALTRAIVEAAGRVLDPADCRKR